MKKTLSLIMAVLLPACYALALDMTAEVKTDVRVLMDTPAYNPEYQISFNRSDLVLKFNQSTDNMKGYAELDLVSWGVPGTGLLSYSDVSPYEIRLNEAYAGFYKVGFDFLDITVGKQVVSWGTADKLNQTDILTPYDFSDPLDFNKRIGANMLRADVNAGPVTVQGIFIPVFSQSLLHSSMAPDIMVEKQALKALSAYPVDVALTDVSVLQENPEMKIENYMAGV
ncbi:MAG: hypothetical protein LLG37_11020, partial [Spirochaetia bacterium]|nr:hypothetical protein [Spirochaetia bacterium]